MRTCIHMLTPFRARARTRFSSRNIERMMAMVRKGGFEPPRLSAPPPQDGVSASSTTSALDSMGWKPIGKCNFYPHLRFSDPEDHTLYTRSIALVQASSGRRALRWAVRCSGFSLNWTFAALLTTFLPKMVSVLGRVTLVNVSKSECP